MPSNAPRDEATFRVLLTRSDLQTEGIVNSLATLGIACVSEPMLTIQDVVLPEVAHCNTAALVFTSANGVDAFVRQSGQLRSKALYAVGPQTADRLVAHGAQSFHSGEGDAASLLKLIYSTWRPTDGKIVHISGEHVSTDLAIELSRCGYQSARLVGYSAVPATKISNSTLEELHNNAFDGVVFMSRRAARTFCSFPEVTVRIAARRLAAFCMSKAISDTILPGLFHQNKFALSPTRSALLQLLTEHRAQPATNSLPM
jgi:uroporphyrinogen-III synthase